MNPPSHHDAEPPHVEGLTIRRLVGEGGFARVWLATDPALGRDVAVKVLTSRLTNDATAQRFRRECMALGAVSGHPNIVTVHAVGTTDDGLAHIVMGYERGGFPHRGVR